MYKLKFFKKAKEQYINIGKYIAQDNLFYANQVLKKIDDSVDTILEFPFIGKEIDSGIRMVVEPTYKFKIVYEIRKDYIYILSVFKYKNSWE